MAPRRPGPGELLAGVSGLLLLVAMFLPWFGLDGRARVPGSGQVITVEGGNLDAWEAFGAIDFVLALAALLAIAVLVVSLMSTPPPGLAFAATGAAALAALLIVYRVIDAPDIPVEDAGDTAYETGRRLGAFFGLLCTAGIAWAANLAAPAATAPASVLRRPPGKAPEPAPSAAPRRALHTAPAPAAYAAPATPSQRPAAAPGPLGGWSRPAIEAECQAAWRRHDRRLGARYARYFEEHPELVGEQRSAARDLAAALPPGWDALAAAIPTDGWQRQHLSGKSSQTLGVGLLGAAAGRNPSLAWLWDALAPLPAAGDGAPTIEFEHVVDPDLLGERPRQTSLDVLIDDPNVLIGIEAKWREHGIGPCRCRGDGVGPTAGERCARRVEQRDAYWETAATVLGLGDRDPDTTCPVSPAYEWVRHAAALRALAGPGRLAVLALLYDADNPYFAADGDWPGWPALLSQAVDANADPERFRFAAVSWQELVPTLPLDEQASAWAADKHGLG
ncbi:MAG: hypothetical protein H0T69_16170 [Thermoleophilaceae bacterium]|nr:hypothetical protein [Thermoleophilaceae bacterium]